MEIIILFIVQWYVSVFMQSFYLHRFAAHGMMEMSFFWSRIFYLITTVVQGPSFLNPRAYAILHTLHHGFSDTEKDPHSPHYTNNALTMVWETFNIYTDIRKRRIHQNFPIKRECVDWSFFENINNTRLMRIALIGLYFALYWNFATSPWLWLLFPVHLFIGPLQGALVNWFGHKYGYVNYDDVKDHSRNTLLVDFLCLGELYQNNHHKYPKDINFAQKKNEKDLSLIFIEMFEKMGIVTFARRIRTTGENESRVKQST